MNVATKSDKLMKGSTGDWEVVIGMEVHAQVNSNFDLLHQRFELDSCWRSVA